MKANPKLDQTDVGELAFEDALDRLETIVGELERGQPELSLALANYETGLRMLNHCHAVLARAERSVALLTGVDDEGNPITAEFDASATVPRKTS